VTPSALSHIRCSCYLRRGGGVVEARRVVRAAPGVGGQGGRSLRESGTPGCTRIGGPRQGGDSRRGCDTTHVEAFRNGRCPARVCAAALARLLTHPR